MTPTTERSCRESDMYCVSSAVSEVSSSRLSCPVGLVCPVLPSVRESCLPCVRLPQSVGASRAPDSSSVMLGVSPNRPSVVRGGCQWLRPFCWCPLPRFPLIIVPLWAKPQVWLDSACSAPGVGSPCAGETCGRSRGWPQTKTY